MLDITENIKFSNKRITSILSDAEKTAQAIDLVYVQDKQPGISWVKKENIFHYCAGTKKLLNKKLLNVLINWLFHAHGKMYGFVAWTMGIYKQLVTLICLVLHIVR